jgi:signal peptidase II
MRGPKGERDEDAGAQARQRSLKPRTRSLRDPHLAPQTATHSSTGAQAPGSAKARTRALARAGAVALVVVIIDQLTKHLVRSGIDQGNVHKLLPGVHLVHVRNTGVAFSLFSGGGTLVLVFTFAALASLVVYLTVRPDRRLLWLPTGMLVGGAIGNLIDRVSSGAVTDFIKLPAWPAFNVADMSITFGVLVLLWVLERRRGDER